MKNTAHRSLRVRGAFCAYLLLSFIVTTFYIFTFGYSFWGTDTSSLKLDILVYIILLIIIAFQFHAKTRVWSWLILSPSYVFVLLVLSNFERFDINVVYLGVLLTGVMMTLAALLNRFLTV